MINFLFQQKTIFWLFVNYNIWKWALHVEYSTLNIQIVFRLTESSSYNILIVQILGVVTLSFYEKLELFLPSE